MESIARKLKSTLPSGIIPESPGKGPQVLSCRDPQVFWSRLLGCLEKGRTAALFDPDWPEKWTQSLGNILMGGHLCHPPGILPATSGSTGLPKFCIHNPDTLGAAAGGFAERFGRLGIIHSVNVLPQHHVGGLMPVWRSAYCGGRVHFADYRDPGSIAAAGFKLEEASLSLVPTQLARMLDKPESTAILRRFGLILVGGAACPKDLLEQARDTGLRLAPCYGSTETAAMVAALDPEAFLEGATGVGTPMPHARIETDSGGRIRVRSPSLLNGYLPPVDGFSRDPFPCGDIGHFDRAGNLHIDGRADRAILSGGEVVHPEAVEEAALASGMVTEARCMGIADPDWGQQLQLVVKPLEGISLDHRILLEHLRSELPPHAVPKAIRESPASD